MNFCKTELCHANVTSRTMWLSSF